MFTSLNNHRATRNSEPLSCGCEKSMNQSLLKKAESFQRTDWSTKRLPVALAMLFEIIRNWNDSRLEALWLGINSNNALPSFRKQWADKRHRLTGILRLIVSWKYLQDSSHVLCLLTSIFVLSKLPRDVYMQEYALDNIELFLLRTFSSISLTFASLTLQN